MTGGHVLLGLAIGALVGITLLGAVALALSYSPIYTREYWERCADRCADFGEPYRAMLGRQR